MEPLIGGQIDQVADAAGLPKESHPQGYAAEFMLLLQGVEQEVTQRGASAIDNVVAKGLQPPPRYRGS
jgi:hypothetical protein